MSSLLNWSRTKVSEAYRNGGVVKTAYGRPRRLKHYLTSQENMWRSFGERSVPSHLVSGLCADIMRSVLVRVTNELLIPFPDQVRWIGCIHDELNLAVNKEHFSAITAEVRKIMEVIIPSTDIRLSTSVEVGYSYGGTFPFEQGATGEWVPKFA